MTASLLASYQQRVDAALEHWLPPATVAPTHLHEAMRYAVLGPGKRVRPALCYATGDTLGIPLEQLDGPACAVELVHAYSLVHDDLPAMDNDDLRRGRPTCHRQFDEATAILAGDALMALAFRILAHDPAMAEDADTRLHMIDVLATACGSRGMVGGQALDLAAEGKTLDRSELEHMHIRKTGALIHASVMLAALSSLVAGQRQRDHLDRMAKHIGLAFQIQDDVLDVCGDPETLGKTGGRDRDRLKATYPEVMGLEPARVLARELHEQALKELAPFGERADPLRVMCDFLMHRDT